MSLAFFEALSEALRRHGRVALATVVRATGSTPRRLGARMLVTPSATVDTIGGGKFESLVVADARRLLAEGGPPSTRDYSFAPTGKDSFGAVCGGTLTVLLEVVERAPRLLVVGAGHCGRALAKVADAIGYEITVADERADQLDPAAFPARATLVTVAEDYADLPLPAPGDFVALVSRGHATDGRALRRLRGVPVAYLGMIGSAAKRKALFGELVAEGFSEEELARVRNPIGLPIGAESPDEIAISILAEIIQRRRQG